MIISLSSEAKDTADFLMVGADAIGRGGTYLAVKDSNYAVFQNYAFLHDSQTPRMSLSTFRLLDEVSYLTASYSHSNLSFGLMNRSNSSGYYRDENNKLIGSGEIRDNEFALYAACGFIKDWFGVGARLKYFYKDFSIVNESASGAALDLAAFADVNRYITLGAELNNVIGTGMIWSTGKEEEFMRTFGLGARFKVLGLNGLLQVGQFAEQEADIFLDIIFRDDNMLGHVGFEYRPLEYMALRLGLMQYPELTDTVYRLTAGLGFNWENIYFDYAYAPGEFSDDITHFFTLSYRFTAKQEMPTIRIY